MGNEVSVFIMDVSNSSKEEVGNELSDYLQQLQVSIAYWTQNIVPTKVIHRAGDELVVVSSGYGTAYTLAFYLSRIWKFVDHPPYFGFSFGNIQEEIRNLNIDTWIHPLMKEARIANNYLKNQANRRQFYFKLPDSPNENSSPYIKSFEVLLNTSLHLKQEQINAQTDIQALVCSLYLLLGQQNKVSEYLERTRSTISSHMKNGKTEVILEAFFNIVGVLNSFEAGQTHYRTDELQTSIRQNIIHRLHDYLPKEGRL